VKESVRNKSLPFVTLEKRSFPATIKRNARIDKKKAFSESST
jgi:hypothetical protein